MTAQVLHTAEPVTQFPISETGEPFRFCWATAESLVFADTVTEIIAELYPTYAALLASSDDAAMLEFRSDRVVELAEVMQDVLLAELQQQLDAQGETEPLPEDFLSVLLARKDGPIIDLDGWPFDMPLYLLSTQYAPYTEVPAPAGDSVRVLDAVSELGFLQSLQELQAGALLLQPSA